MDLLRWQNVWNEQGKEVSFDTAFANKDLLILFFGASWCDASVRFAPTFANFFRNARLQGVEACLVSLDLEPKSMYRFMGGAGLCSLAVEPQTGKADKLVQRFQVRKLPAVVVVDRQGNVVCEDGKEEVEKNGPWAVEKWRKVSMDKMLSDS